MPFNTAEFFSKRSFGDAADKARISGYIWVQQRTRTRDGRYRVYARKIK